MSVSSGASKSILSNVMSVDIGTKLYVLAVAISQSREHLSVCSECVLSLSTFCAAQDAFSFCHSFYVPRSFRANSDDAGID